MTRVFRVPFDGHVLVGDVMAGAGQPRLLLLHGAGTSCRERWRQLREHFSAHGIGSVAFDCIGHGDTGGELKATSLRSRTEQACAVIEAIGPARPLAVLGASMGGYTAVTLLSRYPVESLILVGPAMYVAEAYAVPFGAGFTEIIRRPRSWEGSDAWALLAGFAGRLLIVAGEHDAVIPPDVIQNIHDSARQARERTLYVAQGASHLIITDLRAHAPAQLDHVLELMTRTIGADGTDGVS